MNADVTPMWQCAISQFEHFPVTDVKMMKLKLKLHFVVSWRYSSNNEAD